MQRIRGTTRLLGLLGHPVAHSLSPAMHNAAIEAHGLDLAYVPLPVAPEKLAEAVAGLRAVDFLGANVTIPHKQTIIPLLDEVSDIARRMGAVNTITHRDGKLHGTTTDPEGFLAAFRAAGHDFAGKSVAVLGNGGSARTLAFALALMSGAARVSLVARAPEKSGRLLAEIRDAAPGFDIASVPISEYGDVRRNHDIVVNATPVGMHPRVEASPLAEDLLEPGQTVYDIVYNPEETALLRAAKARGCATVGGIGMLVHQGLASFEAWTGIRPSPETFLAGIDAARNHGNPQ